MGIQDALRTLNSQAEAQMRSKEKLISDKAQEVFSTMCQAIAKEISSSNGNKYRIEGQLKPFTPIIWHTNPSAADVQVFAKISYSYSHTNKESFWAGKKSSESHYDLSIQSTDAWLIFINALNAHIKSEKGLSCRVYLDFQPFSLAGKDILLWNSENQPQPFNIRPYVNKYQQFTLDHDPEYCRFEVAGNRFISSSKNEGRLISGRGLFYLLIEYTYCMS